MSEPKQYKIVRLSDFMKVPPDRRADCLSEFLVALKYADDTLKSAKSKAETMKGIKGWIIRRFGAAIAFGSFTWIDDTRRHGTVFINDKLSGADTGTYHTDDYTAGDPRRVQ